MSFSVYWPEESIDRLARAYMDACLVARGDEFRRAVERIEGDLARIPTNLGEAREGSNRICFELPASIRFRVDEANRQVAVLNVMFHP